MKKLAIAALVAASLATPALADKPRYPNPKNDTFETRGACEAAIVHKRNQRRGNSNDPSAINERFKDQWYCEPNGDGTWTARRG
jgi:hypothetical protein